MGDEFGALGPEIAVAQPAVVLASGIDHPAHGLPGDLPDRGVDLARALEGRATVDQHRAGRRHDQADVGIEALVVDAARTFVADVGINAVGDRPEVDLQRQAG